MADTTSAVAVSKRDFDLARLQRQVRLLQVLNLTLFIAIGVGLMLGMQTPQQTSAAGTGQQEPTRFREITVERINVAGPDGVRRYIISHDAPKAPFAGREWERTVPPGMGALLMLDPQGNEVGGYASSDSHSMLSLDFRDYPLEAIVLGTGKTPNGQESAIVLNQPPTGPPIDLDAVMRGLDKQTAGSTDTDDPDIKELNRHNEMQRSRIALGASAKRACIQLNDSKGQMRIGLQVDENDNPEIVLYDAEGNETARFPDARQAPRQSNQ